jgi:hypothetical protein
VAAQDSHDFPGAIACCHCDNRPPGFEVPLVAPGIHLLNSHAAQDHEEAPIHDICYRQGIPLYGHVVAANRQSDLIRCQPRMPQGTDSSFRLITPLEDTHHCCWHGSPLPREHSARLLA